MDLREILKEAGLEDKAIKQVLTSMKAEKIYTTTEENADVRIRKYKEKLEKVEGELDEAVTKIDSYKDLETKNTTLTNEIETLKKASTEKEFNSILSNNLKEAKSKNNKLITALLDRDKLTLKDGKIEGLEEQLKAIREENEFLFEKETRGIPDFNTGGKTGSNSSEEKSLGGRLAESIKANKEAGKVVDDFFK